MDLTEVKIRLEYLWIGTDFTPNVNDGMGWRRGNAEETARSIANVINNKSNLVFANVDGAKISFELEMMICDQNL